MRLKTLVVVAGLALACSDSAGPPGPVPAGQLHFVVQDPTAPPLIANSASFYAKVGEDRRVELFYQGATPGDTGEAFFRFDVHAASLLKRPDGTAFQPGDSILITVTIDDPSRFDFTFAPAGLQFNPSEPARLHIEYNHSDHDFNEDGRHDAEDDRTETMLRVWRNEPPDTLWSSIGSVKIEEFDEIEAAILSFSHYAVAW